MKVARMELNRAFGASITREGNHIQFSIQIWKLKRSISWKELWGKSWRRNNNSLKFSISYDAGTFSFGIGTGFGGLNFGLGPFTFSIIKDWEDMYPKKFLRRYMPLIIENAMTKMKKEKNG